MCFEQEQQEYKPRSMNTNPEIKKKKKKPQISHRSSINPQKNLDPLCFSLSVLDQQTTQSLPIGHGVKERDKDDELERERTGHQEIELRR